MVQPSSSVLLSVRGLRKRFGGLIATDGVDLEVRPGEIHALIGPNGAGKTTLLKAISRSIGSQGKLLFKDQSLDGVAPYDVVARGICHCPEGRKLFSELSVLKNLQLGAYLRSNKAEINADLERVFTLFPVLRERQWQQSSTLSGGEQQMVAIGRALMGRPELLLLDEPSVGIAPRLKGLIFDAIQQIRKDGTAILIVEQDATSTLKITDRVYVLEHGRTIREGTAKEIASDKYIQQVYLGV